MSKSSQDTINDFTKSELKTELNKQDFIVIRGKRRFSKKTYGNTE